MQPSQPAPETRTLESTLARLSPEAYYQSPGGRRMLIAGALVAGVKPGTRVLDVQCGIGSASVDLAEAFSCVVTGFDDYSPYLAFGRQQAAARGVGKQVTFKPIAGPEAPDAFGAGSFDLVLGLGGGLSDTLPGGLAGGIAAASRWLVPGGLVIAGDLVAPGTPSDLMQFVFGESLLGEERYFQTLDEAGYDIVFACRSTSADWDQMRSTMDRLRQRSLDLGPDDERQRQRLTDAARNHPELAYLNVVARKRS
jgi:SAM-dependent methyltransferase